VCEEINRSDFLVSEPIEPVAGTFDTGAMARGEPGLPSRFVWRKKEYAVTWILDRWKETSPCKGGAREKYVRKHWYKIRVNSGEVMQIYFERRSMTRGQGRRSWWLFSVSPSPQSPAVMGGGGKSNVP
jgi:hypothetical protein